METVHAGSPTKHPARRLETLNAAGELRIPFTTGILVGIGEDEDERVASLEALAEVQARHGHIQEVILQNYVPHPRYYGEEVADIADDAAKRRWESGITNGQPQPRPEWASDVTIDDMKRLIAECKRLMPGRRRPDPAEPRRLVGGAGRGRRHRPRRPLGQRRPHLARASVPEPPPGAQGPEPARLRADRAALRLSPVPGPRLDGAGRARRGQAQVLELHPAPRLGPRTRDAARRGDRPARDRARPGGRGADRGGAHGAVRRDAPRGDRGDAHRPPTSCAPSSPGDVATFVVNRNINFTNICIVGCAFCGFGQGKRSPDAYMVTEEDFEARIGEAVDFGATEICMQGGIHPEYELSDYGRWLRLIRGHGPRAPHPRLLADGDPLHVRALGQEPRGRLRLPARVRPGFDAGNRRRGPPRRGAPAHLAEQAPRGPLGRDHRGLAPLRVAIHVDGDVRPHRGAVGARRPHARDPRAAGAHGRDHRVRPPQLHPLQHLARADPRGRGDLGPRQPQAHRRLSASRSAARSPTSRRAG